MNRARIRAHALNVDCAIAIDLIQSAWGLADEEFERILLVSPGWLHAWRTQDRNDVDQERVRRLVRFHRSMMLVADPGGYPEFIKRSWSVESRIGLRSILDAITDENGAEAMDKIEALFWTS